MKKGILTSLGLAAVLTLGLASVNEYREVKEVDAAETYEKATSIAVGDTVVLVCESKKMELSSIGSSGSYGSGTAYSSYPAGLYPLTVAEGSSSGTYAFKISESEYVSWSSGNSLAISNSINDNSSWKVSFDGTNHTILNAKDNARKLQWNAGSPRFACYTSSQTVVQLYVKSTEPVSDDQLVQELVDGYVSDGVYTKTTKINLDSSSNALKTELASYKFEDLFHAKASNLERITYYNDDELLMTNKEETYNSGYGTVTLENLSAVQKVNSTAAIGDMTHFTYNGTTQVYDYIVKNTHENWNDPTDVGMEGFYVTPKDFSAEGYFTQLYTGWENSGENQYTLEVSNSDEIVGDFVNVVAPLLLDTVLTTNYIRVTSLVVKETADGLVLQIIADGDEGKLGGSTVLAEATITKECEKEFGYVNPSQKYNCTFEKSNFAIESDNTTAGGTATLNNISWTYTDSVYLGFGDARGMQVGKSKANEPSFVLSTSYFADNNYKINSIVVNSSIASDGDGTLTIQVGDTVALDSQSLTTTATDYVATFSELTGNVSITLSAGNKAMYIKSITVYYTVAE